MMRKMEYLSPTSLALFYKDREKFYQQYLSEVKLPREPQTPPMSVGSAFDAYVKSFLVEKLIGKDPRFEFNTIFEAQVEKHNRDEARAAGKEVWEWYQKYGALTDLLLDLEGCIGTPRFETKIEGYVECVAVGVGGIPLLGKPDIYFIGKEGARVIFDWKVNGYYSQSAYTTSPKAGFIRCLPDRSSHKKAIVSAVDGFKVNIALYMEHVDPEWAAQTAVYGWLLGQDVGSRFISAIDQIVVDPRNGPRTFRIAQHRAMVSADFQKQVFDKAFKAWQAIQSGHIFSELTFEQSQARCALLDQVAQGRASMPPDPDFDFVTTGRER
jgi:hypothetical protein